MKTHLQNILLFFCFCVTAGTGIVQFHTRLNRPVLNPQAEHSISHPVTPKIATKPVAQPIDRPALTQSPALTVIETALTNAPTDDGAEASAQKQSRLLQTLREWAAKDAESALAAAMKLPEGDERNQALTAVCFGLAQTDPADAVKLAQSLALDQQPGGTMENLVQQWAATDITSALTWVDNQPAGEERDGLNTRIAYVLSQTDPTDAANLVMKQISPGSAQDEALMSVLNQWANQNLSAASTWVKGFTGGPLQERALAELAGIANRQQALVQR